MIKINVVAVGKVKEKYFNEAIEEYKKRLSRFCELSITEVKEENFKNPDGAAKNFIKEKEGERILPFLKGEVYVFSPEGKKFTSEKFAEKIKEAADRTGVLTFVIGGSYGLSQKIKDLAKELISFSDMTFPHTLFRVLLTEQIYRAFCITEGNPYHK